MKTTTTETSIPEEKTTSARIQAYSKSQLAALYLPHIQPASARRTLRSWIAKNTELQAALTRSGYTGKAILLTPAQVGLFFRFWESLRKLSGTGRTHIETDILIFGTHKAT